MIDLWIIFAIGSTGIIDSYPNIVEGFTGISDLDHYTVSHLWMLTCVQLVSEMPVSVARYDNLLRQGT